MREQNAAHILSRQNDDDEKGKLCSTALMKNAAETEEEKQFKGEEEEVTCKVAIFQFSLI